MKTETFRRNDRRDNAQTWRDRAKKTITPGSETTGVERRNLKRTSPSKEKREVQTEPPEKQQFHTYHSRL
jgi:hypothetical protein